MRLRSVPQRARLAADPGTVFGRFAEHCDLAGARVLEVGGRLPEDWVAGAGVVTWWSVDPRNPGSEDAGLTAEDPGAPAPGAAPTDAATAVATSTVVRPLRAIAARIPLPDDAVDLVFSCNALQHVHDLGPSLAEIARVLRPGGYLYANFGPVWSGPDGSHLEDLQWQGRRLDFWRRAVVPSWAHLALTEDELLTALSGLHGAAMARAICDYVHHSDWINRLFFDDYRELIAASPFEVVFLEGNADLDYPYDPPSLDSPWRERLSPEALPAVVERLRGRRYRDFVSRDVELLLHLPDE